MELRDFETELIEQMKKTGSTVGSDCKIGSFCVIGRNVKIGNQVKIHAFVQIDDDVEIGNNVMIKEYTRIDKGVKIGNNVQIRGHSVICQDARIDGMNDLGHGLYLVNHKKMNKFAGKDDVAAPHIRKGARIGAQCMLMPGVTIGLNSMVGEGSIVRKDVPDNEVWITTNTITKIRDVKDEEKIIK